MIDKISKLLRNMALLIFSCFFVLAILSLLTVYIKQKTFIYIIGFFLAISFSILSLFFIKKKKLFDKIFFWDKKYDLLLLVIICFTIRYIWIIGTDIIPFTDYTHYYNMARYFSGDFNISINELKYILTFPHIAGHSLFLSFFFRLFGASVFNAQLFNIILSILSMIMIYKISIKLFDRKCAIISSLLWAFFPNQIFWSAYVFQGALFSLLLLLIIYVLISDFKGKIILKYALLGLLIGCLNITRPFGLIALITLFLKDFFLDKNKFKFIKKILFIFLTVAIYTLVNITFDNYLKSISKIEPAGTSYYTLYVGLSKSGTWNEEDASVFAEKRISLEPKEVQLEFKNLFTERLKNNEINFLWWPSKIYYMWGHEGKLGSSEFFGTKKMGEIFNYTAILYYIVLLTISVFTGILLFLKRKDSKLTFMFVYLIGIIIVHMITEVNYRYHYQLYLFLCLFSGYFLSNNFKIKLFNKEYKL